jgi:hypothetical protein
LFDIHGLPTCDKDGEEDSKKLEEQMKALDDELEKFDADKKSAYEQAKYLNPDFVQGRGLRLQFLRCNDYDTALAVDQIVQHFETKRKWFGSGGVLGRPVLLSDLTDGALECLELGSFQILPSRDGAGRIVIFMAPGYARFDAMDDMVRRFIFCTPSSPTRERTRWMAEGHHHRRLRFVHWIDLQ